MDLSAFAAVFIALYVGHHVGDHWLQTHHQALTKGAPSADGRLACARHVLTLTTAKLVALVAVVAVADVRVSMVAVTTGLTVDAASHYWADRAARHPNSIRVVTLARLADALGKGGFYRFGSPRQGRDDQPHLGTGAYALDQSWHTAWLFIAALIIAALIIAGGA